MATATRVYLVLDNGKAVGLQRAASPATAIREHLGERFEAHVADQDELIKYLGDGIKVGGDATTPDAPE